MSQQQTDVVNSTDIYTTRYDKSGKHYGTKKIETGKCIFPFSYKKKLYYECLDTGKGPWCATKLKGNNIIDKWAYCLPKDTKID